MQRSFRVVDRPFAFDLLVIIALASVIGGTGQSTAQAQAVSLSGSGSTLAATLYSDVLFAYSFVEPTVTISYSPIGSTKGKAALEAFQTDWGGSDSPFTSADYKKEPDLENLPTAAAAVSLLVGLLAVCFVLGRLCLCTICVS